MTRLTDSKLFQLRREEENAQKRSFLPSSSNEQSRLTSASHSRTARSRADATACTGRHRYHQDPAVATGCSSHRITSPGSKVQGHYTQFHCGRYMRWWWRIGTLFIYMQTTFLCLGGFAHVYLARIEGKSGFVVLKRVAVPDTERLKTVEKEIAFMVIFFTVSRSCSRFWQDVAC